MYYVGMDVHKGQWVICVVDGNGKVVSTKQVVGTWKQCVGYVGTIEGPKSVVFEASCGMGWLHDRLAEVCERVVVADPNQLASSYVTKRKNDRIDAQRLARLLFLDMIPAVYVASVETRAWRALIEQRRSALARCTAIKSRIKALLRGQGQEGKDHLWTNAGRKWMEGLEFEAAADKARLEFLLADLDSAAESLYCVTKALDKISTGDSRVELMMKAPGVGIRTAEAVAAYVEEAKRFGNSKCVGSYFGLVPEQEQSGNTNHLGKITRRGPSVVRWLLVEAAWQGIRRSPRLRRIYDKVLRGQPSRKKIATVAVAHFLARALVAMLKSGEDWKEVA